METKHKINILYAEDNKSSALILKKLLEKDDFLVHVVNDGTEAWALLQAQRPDILLLDINMPGKDGLEILKLFRQDNRQTPVVIFSGYLHQKRELQAIELGADDCIRKRCSIPLLIAKLKNVYKRVTQGERNPQVYELSSTTKYNAEACTLTINGVSTLLKSREAKLMRLLCVKFQELATYDYLIEGMWGSAKDSKQGALRKYIFELKQKLSADPSLTITASRDTGYILTQVDSPPRDL
ncbi:response regulator transcription factor [Butyricimonas sp.]|uniref:response regulator transcription factor n=1 Tax=Butyricimonas sp. TaxID=1969738 RepID=UPI0025B9E6E0|nr:response regulator transcription factor [Butyricimonas sp.]